MIKSRKCLKPYKGGRLCKDRSKTDLTFSFVFSPQNCNGINNAMVMAMIMTIIFSLPGFRSRLHAGHPGQLSPLRRARGRPRVRVLRAPYLSIRIPIWILASDTDTDTDICPTQPIITNTETAMLSRYGFYGHHVYHGPPCKPAFVEETKEVCHIEPEKVEVHTVAT